MVNGAVKMRVASFWLEVCTQILVENVLSESECKLAVKLKSACRNYINMFNNVFDEDEETL